MNRKLSLDTPVRSLVTRILSDPEYKNILEKLQENQLIFCGLVHLGCDFYETLELFAGCGAIDPKSADCILHCLPDCQTSGCTEKEIRKMIPHWTSSRYRTASIEDICLDLRQKAEAGEDGVFVYNSNLNTKDKKVYNDIYVLIIRNKEIYFFDINRKKTFHIQKNGQEDLS